MGEEIRPQTFRIGHAQRLRDRNVEGRARGTGDPADRACRSEGPYRASAGQVPALLEEVKLRTIKGERMLVTTLTKRLAEDLSRYLKEQGLRCKWLHSELDAFERMTILRELREGGFDVLVGVNLLREGLDLPEVSMVCILDADKEGFLRSETSLIQTIGRSARHVNAEVVLYADKVTNSMQRAMDESAAPPCLAACVQCRTRNYSGIHRESDSPGNRGRNPGQDDRAASGWPRQDHRRQRRIYGALESEMLDAAEKLEFERAAACETNFRAQIRTHWRSRATSREPPGAKRTGRAKARAKGGRRKQ